MRLAAFRKRLYNGFIWGDHQQYLVIYDDLKSHPILETIWNAVKKDSIWRWRPFFILQYCIGAIFFHNNWLIMHLFLAIIWSIDATLLYCTAREFRISRVYAVLYVGTCLIGRQMQLLFDLCVAGGICLLPVCLCIYSLSKYKIRCKTKYLVSINISLLLLLFTLEDYFICIPFFVAIYILIYQENNNCSLWTSIKENLVMIIVWIIACASVVYYILTKTAFSLSGKSKIGSIQLGAGIDTSKLSLTSMFHLLGYMHGSLAILCIIIPLAILTKQIYRHKLSLNKIIFSLVIFVFLISEIIIHSQHPIDGRYWLPMLVPIASVICIIFPREFNNKIFRIIVALLLIWNLVRCTVDSYLLAEDYRNSFLSYDEMASYIVNEIPTKKSIWLEFGLVDNNLEIGLQMLLDEKGFSNIYFSGQNNELVDMYKVKADGIEYTNEITIGQNYRPLYECFGYYPQKIKTIDSRDIDVIICTSDGLDTIYEIIGKQYLVNTYSESCVGAYIVYEKSYPNN